ncbi:MAG: hypothetical protein RM368_08135 [Nostoc sp. DedSLP03]|uniref:hypothetical protein n=1 Tax=Nostoc sp. DedSLP03 TaxID=3075400 RepID=UPI002AD40FE5|nr:hypothetical protein [Nostoc sp. DedSLP03]MDZ7964933.1 hypothetical protein [Nostoc sp. DedSLP03]
MNTSTSIYDSFISLDNLKLAWERVRYFDRSDSRDWIGLKVFAANRDYNLELLRQTLMGRTFEASYPEIKYLPKASQTLRLTMEKLGLNETQQLSEYSINSARGYDNSLPHLQSCYIRHTFTKFYRVKFSEPVDFHALLGSEYKRATKFLWQSDKSYLPNPSRYVSQLDLFHEELLYPIIVDKLKLKPSREDVLKMALPDRMEYIHTQLQEKKLSIFATALLKCHKLRSSSTEAHTRLHKILDPTNPVGWHERDALKKYLCGAYQELVDWLLQNK